MRNEIIKNGDCPYCDIKPQQNQEDDYELGTMDRLL